MISKVLYENIENYTHCLPVPRITYYNNRDTLIMCSVYFDSRGFKSKPQAIIQSNSNYVDNLIVSPKYPAAVE